MELDFTPYFEQYKILSKAADDIFQRLQKEYPDCVACEVKCADCCHALFDITLIEAIYINSQFTKKFQGREKEQLIEKANRADRSIHKIKRKAHKDVQAGKKEDQVLTALAEERCRCPLLNDDDLCDLYEHRPITCRLYGIPTSIGGAGHTCGKTRFKEGEKYPTVNLDAIQKKLYEISRQLVADIKTRYLKMADMLVPLSMAMITVYDPEYLGIKGAEKDNVPKGKDND